MKISPVALLILIVQLVVSELGLALDADLQVTTFSEFQPGTITPGSHPTKLGWTVINYGPFDIGSCFGFVCTPGPILIDVWFSEDTRLGNGDDLHLGTLKLRQSLPAGSRSTITVESASGFGTLTVPTSAAGDYYVFLRLVPDSDGSNRSDPDWNDNFAMLGLKVTVPGPTPPPKVVSIERLSPSNQLTHADTVIWRVSFSKTVNGVDRNDFAVIDAQGTIGNESVISVSNSSGSTVDVTASTGTIGDGDLRLDLVPGASITGDDGRSLEGGFTSGAVYSIDRTLPFVKAIRRFLPGDYVSTTSASAVTWRVDFSEHVSGVDAAAFSLVSLSGNLADVRLLSVLAGPGDSFDVTADTGVGTGDLRLDVISSTASISDTAQNPLAVSFQSGEVFSVDKGPFRTHVVLHSLSAADSVTIGNSVTNFMVVTNRGPRTASQVWLTNLVPDGAILVAHSVDRGTSTASNKTVECNFGALAVGEFAVASIVWRPLVIGTLTNSLNVSASEEPYPEDETSGVLVTESRPPRLAITAIELPDGNRGVRLSFDASPALTSIIQFRVHANGLEDGWREVAPDVLNPGSVTIPAGAPRAFFRLIQTADPGQ